MVEQSSQPDVGGQAMAPHTCVTYDSKANRSGEANGSCQGLWKEKTPKFSSFRIRVSPLTELLLSSSAGLCTLKSAKMLCLGLSS